MRWRMCWRRAKGAGVAAAATISSWGYPLAGSTMTGLAHAVGEQTLLNRAGGAPSLAVGMAQIFSNTIGGDRLLSIWYHFAIMFEALFILTVLDAGTRVGRFMIQELGGRIWKPMGRLNWMPGILISSALIVGAWGYFLYQGVIDPMGGINTLWPLFGISNQMLAGIALITCTVVLFKMKRERYAWVTILPTVWLLVCTLTAGLEKVFSSTPAIGFVSHAWRFSDALSAGKILAPAKTVEEMQRVIVNDYVDATLAALFIAVVVAMAVYGVIGIRRALGTQRVTTVEVGGIDAVAEPGHA